MRIHKTYKKLHFHSPFRGLGGLLFILFLTSSSFLHAQLLSPDIQKEIGDYLTSFARKEISVGKIKIDSVAVEKKQLQLYANINASYIPFREDNVKEIYQNVRAILPAEFANSNIKIFANKKPIEELVPLALQSKKNKKIKTFSPKVKTPLITRISEIKQNLRIFYYSTVVVIEDCRLTADSLKKKLKRWSITITNCTKNLMRGLRKN